VARGAAVAAGAASGWGGSYHGGYGPDDYYETYTAAPVYDGGYGTDDYYGAYAAAPAYAAPVYAAPIYAAPVYAAPLYAAPVYYGGYVTRSYMIGPTPFPSYYGW
jgi:hypothetical protein